MFTFCSYFVPFRLNRLIFDYYVCSLEFFLSCKCVIPFNPIYVNWFGRSCIVFIGSNMGIHFIQFIEYINEILVEFYFFSFFKLFTFMESGMDHGERKSMSQNIINFLQRLVDQSSSTYLCMDHIYGCQSTISKL